MEPLQAAKKPWPRYAGRKDLSGRTADQRNTLSLQHGTISSAGVVDAKQASYQEPYFGPPMSLCQSGSLRFTFVHRTRAVYLFIFTPALFQRKDAQGKTKADSGGVHAVQLALETKFVFRGMRTA